MLDEVKLNLDCWSRSTDDGCFGVLATRWSFRTTLEPTKNYGEGFSCCLEVRFLFLFLLLVLLLMIMPANRQRMRYVPHNRFRLEARKWSDNDGTFSSWTKHGSEGTLISDTERDLSEFSSWSPDGWTGGRTDRHLMVSAAEFAGGVDLSGFLYKSPLQSED